MKEQWTKQMRERLADHRKEPPPGLWEAVSEQIGAQPKARRRWPWMAAAAVAVMAGLFALYQRVNEDATPPATKPTAVTTTAKTRNRSTGKAAATYADAAGQHTAPQPADRLVAAAIRREPTRKDAEPDRQEAEPAARPHSAHDAHQPLPTTPPAQKSDTTENAAGQRALTEAAGAPSADAARQANSLTAAERTANGEDEEMGKSARRWTLGVNASGGLLASAMSREEQNVYNDVAAPNPMTNSVEGYSNSMYTRRDLVANHHLPWRIGLTVQRQLSQRLALISGVNYTRLVSEFSLPSYDNITTVQRLHYVGVPVGVAWQLYASGRLHIYLSGGMMLEKCVNDRPWQWSASAAAGAECSVAPHVGIYAQPSLGYYFNDGTALQHYYKEHPFAPTIELGVRLHLKEE